MRCSPCQTCSAPRESLSSAACLERTANAAIGLYAHGLASTLTLRFLTGVFLAGVYPPAMKNHGQLGSREGRGMAIGVLVGALTIGSASPHLINTVSAMGDAGSSDPIGAPTWRSLMFFTSALALIAALVCALFVTDGPYHGGRSKVRLALRCQIDEESRNAPGEPRLPRSSVGALRHVDVAADFPPSQLFCQRRR